jgi:hypothetical protein
MYPHNLENPDEDLKHVIDMETGMLLFINTLITNGNDSPKVAEALDIIDDHLKSIFADTEYNPDTENVRFFRQLAETAVRLRKNPPSSLKKKRPDGRSDDLGNEDRETGGFSR